MASASVICSGLVILIICSRLPPDGCSSIVVIAKKEAIAKENPVL